MRESLLARLRGILLRPKNELPKAIAEAGDVKSLLPYILALTAVGAVARFVSGGILGTYIPAQLMFGMKVGGGWVRTPVASLIGAAVSIAIGVGAWLLFSYLLTVLAPSFGARNDAAGARKVAAYAATPVWVASALAVLNSVPYLGIVSLIGHVGALVYGVLIGIWALPLLMGTTESRAPGHILSAMGITVAAACAVLFVCSVLFGATLFR